MAGVSNGEYWIMQAGVWTLILFESSISDRSIQVADQSRLVVVSVV